jgi:hypothetical protein
MASPAPSPALSFTCNPERVLTSPRAVRTASAVALLLICSLTACARPAVTVAAPTPSGAAADACLALATVLPTSVMGFSRREVSDPSPYVAVWGQDALVVLRCGVERPAALTPSAQVLEVNGVDWLPESFERGMVFTTAGRQTYVEVQVPIELRPEARALVDLADAVEQAVPSGDLP